MVKPGIGMKLSSPTISGYWLKTMQNVCTNFLKRDYHRHLFINCIASLARYWTFVCRNLLQDYTLLKNTWNQY